MREYIVQEQDLIDIANAIRLKTSSTANFEVDEMPSAIQSIPTSGGGIDTSDATATASKILSPYTAYAKGNKITGGIPTRTSSNVTVSERTVTIPSGYYASQVTKSVAAATQATPTISVRSDGLITASSTQSAGYVSAGTKTAEHTLPALGTMGYTPTTSMQTISAGKWLAGDQYISGDENLVAGNIKSGVSIFGVNGTYSGEPIQTCNITINPTGPCTVLYQTTDGYNYAYLSNGMGDSAYLQNIIVNSMIVVCHNRLADNGANASPMFGEGIVQKTYAPSGGYMVFNYVFVCTKSCDTDITFTN